MLGRSEIKIRLEREELMWPNTWDPENIRAASYDLRMGTTRFVIIRADGSFQRNGDEEPTRKVCYLNPGDFALLSTEERIRLGPRVAGVVGSKFDIVRQGVLPLTGINVDPGFGQSTQERLHFLVANMSDRPMPLEPGRTRIATIQFHHVEGPDLDGEPYLSNSDEILRQFFEGDEPQLALNLFRGLVQLEQLSGSANNHESRLAALENRTTATEGRVEGLHQGSQQIILFGVILISATIAGVVASVLLQGGLAPGFRGVHLGATVGAIAAVALFGVAIAALTWTLVRFASWIMPRMLSRSQDRPNGGPPTGSGGPAA